MQEGCRGLGGDDEGLVFCWMVGSDVEGGRWRGQRQGFDPVLILKREWGGGVCWIGPRVCGSGLRVEMEWAGVCGRLGWITKGNGLVLVWFWFWIYNLRVRLVY